MEEDSMEVIINGGMIFLFAFGVPQVMHEDNASAVLRDLVESDLQVNEFQCFTSKALGACAVHAFGMHDPL